MLKRPGSIGRYVWVLCLVKFSLAFELPGSDFFFFASFDLLWQIAILSGVLFETRSFAASKLTTKQFFNACGSFTGEIFICRSGFYHGRISRNQHINFLFFSSVLIVPTSNLETRESAYLIVEDEGEVIQHLSVAGPCGDYVIFKSVTSIFFFSVVLTEISIKSLIMPP